PAIEQLRVEAGRFLLELSAPVRDDVLRGQLGSAVTLENLTKGETHPLSMSYPVTEGRQALRQIVLETSATIDEGDQLTLTLGPSALEDLMGNVAVAGLTETVTWSSAADQLLIDTAAPEVEEVCLINGQLVVDFSEPIQPSLLGSVAQVNGSAESWTLSADGYSAELSSNIGTGSHVLEIGDAPLDLSGLGLESEFTVTVEIEQGAESISVFSQPYPGEVAESTVGNDFGFQGLPIDTETGWLYVRNRHLDPEMGRFTTNDPLGYVDGPSAYAFAMNSPVNYADPLGLYCLGFGSEDAECTDWLPYLEPGDFRKERVELIERSRDLSLTQAERNDAAIQSNIQAPGWFFEETGRFLWNTFVHGWAVETDEYAALDRRYRELIGDPFEYYFSGQPRKDNSARGRAIMEQLESEGFDTRGLIKGGMPGPPAGR
ncbi:MAG: RHS repeat-associated core domain-containing protein, partial [Acidobacteriota bacterium]